MTRHDDSISMKQMRDHVNEALELSGGRTRADLDDDRLFALAMTRLLEIVGEAAGRVSTATREKHRAIAWTAIVGLRNWLIHGYDQVDHDIMWAIVQNDLPSLMAELDAILFTE